MRPVQPHDLNCAAPEKAVAPCGLSKTKSAKSAQALARASAAKLRRRSPEYYHQTSRQPQFGDGHPNKVVVGDCAWRFIARSTVQLLLGLTVSQSKLSALPEFLVIRLVAEVTPELCNEYVEWRCSQTDKRATKSKGRTIKVSTAKRELVTLSAALNWCWRNKRVG